MIFWTIWSIPIEHQCQKSPGAFIEVPYNSKTFQNFVGEDWEECVPYTEFVSFSDQSLCPEGYRPSRVFHWLQVGTAGV